MRWFGKLLQLQLRVCRVTDCAWISPLFQLTVKARGSLCWSGERQKCAAGRGSEAGRAVASLYCPETTLLHILLAALEQRLSLCPLCQRMSPNSRKQTALNFVNSHILYNRMIAWKLLLGVDLEHPTCQPFMPRNCLGDC